MSRSFENIIYIITSPKRIGAFTDKAEIMIPYCKMKTKWCFDVSDSADDLFFFWTEATISIVTFHFCGEKYRNHRARRGRDGKSEVENRKNGSWEVKRNVNSALRKLTRRDLIILFTLLHEWARFHFCILRSFCETPLYRPRLYPTFTDFAGNVQLLPRTNSFFLSSSDFILHKSRSQTRHSCLKTYHFTRHL